MKKAQAGKLTSERSSLALLLIDAVNDFDFSAGRKLLKNALPAARKLAKLKERAKNRGIPVIYVNDNFGRWQSDFRSQVAHCRQNGCLGAPIVKLLAPEKDDYFVLKPMHSGFYSTSLEVLLRHLSVKRVILTGFATNICVLFTANDAYMRGYQIVVARDAVAAENSKLNGSALEQMKSFLKAETPLSSRITF